MSRPTLRRYFCALAALGFIAGPLHAAVLNWNSVTWADGSLSNTYLADPTDPQSNVTVSVTPNNGAPLVPFSGPPNPMTPAITQGFQGGLPTIENTLTIAVHLTDSLTQSVSITVSFGSTGGASNVSFKVFGIDVGGPYQNQLTSIQGLSVDGTTLIAPTITPSQNNLLIGTGLTQSVVGTAITPATGPNSGRADATIDFGSNVIQSLTFTFGCTAAYPQPAYEHFAIHDISFTPVPEMNPAFLSTLSCLIATGLVLRHRFKARR